MVTFTYIQMHCNNCEGIFRDMMSRCHKYNFKMVSINGSTTVFQISYSGISEDLDKKNVGEIDTNKQITDLNEESTDESAFSPVPVFSRICSVSVDDNGTMFYTCKHFKQLGLPCVHQASVATFCH